MSKERLAERLRSLADREEKYGLKLLDLRGIGNDYVLMLIRSIGLDSQKHAGLYRAAARILEGKNMSVMASELEWLEKDLRKHIEVEDDMLIQAREIEEKVEDKRIKPLLSAIRRDEESHHPLMRQILEAVLKPEILEDQEVWEMMFGQLPRHGHALDPYAEVDTSTQKI